MSTLDLDEINPHLGLWQSENYVSPHELAYEAWLVAAEKKLGHDLDGNQFRDGYSLDYAYDFFADGLTVDEYVADVWANKVVLGLVVWC